MRNRFKAMKAAAIDKRMPRLPDVFEETPISSGTYGYIFKSVCNPYRVFKTSVQYDVGAFCPVSLKHEYNVSRFISSLIASDECDIAGYPFFSTNSSKFMTTDTFCFFAMDYIRPIEAQTMLIELMPGDSTLKDGFRKAKPLMAEHGTWLQYGHKATKELLDSGVVENMNFNIYCDTMGKFCAACNFLGILLADVEFIVGFNGNRTGVFVLDFDKAIALDEETIYTDVYQGKLETLRFDEFGTMRGVGFDSYSLAQFPYTEEAFNDAYESQIKRLLRLRTVQVVQWVAATARNKINKRMPFVR